MRSPSSPPGAGAASTFPWGAAGPLPARTTSAYWSCGRAGQPASTTLLVSPGRSLPTPASEASARRLGPRSLSRAASVVITPAWSRPAANPSSVLVVVTTKTDERSWLCLLPHGGAELRRRLLRDGRTLRARPAWQQQGEGGRDQYDHGVDGHGHDHGRDRTRPARPQPGVEHRPDDRDPAGHAELLGGREYPGGRAGPLGRHVSQRRPDQRRQRHTLAQADHRGRRGKIPAR